MKKFLPLLVFALPCVLAAQPSSYQGGVLLQSFNNPAFNSKGNVSELWVNGVTVEGWYSSETHITYGWAGAANNPRMYGFRFDSNGNASTVAGALGSKTGGVPIHYAWSIRNDSGQTIDTLTLAFSGFAVNSEVDPDTPDQISFSFKTGGGFDDGDYQRVAALDYTYAGGNARGNPIAGTVQRLRGTLENLNWQPGEVLWLRWTDEHDETFGGVAMGIDHVQISSDTPRASYYDEWEWVVADTMVDYHVDNAHPDASDTNPGTAEQPLQTIQRAVVLARSDSAAGRGSRILVHPGIYRELIDITERSGNLPLELLAVEPGTVVISGSDRFDNWQPVAGMENVYSHHWPFQFGWEPNPWPGNLTLRYPEGTRRELLFNNKRPMTQVVRESELAEGTYIVDEENQRILYFPPFGVDPNANLTEVSVRPEALHGENSKLLRIFRVNNIRVAGLHFEHAAAGSFATDSALALRGSSNVILEDLELTFNNGTGISFGSQGDTPSNNVVMRNIVANFNGQNGMGGGAMNVLMENIETSHNNWRGALWGATGWAPCGFKFSFLIGAILRDFRLTQNHATGGWLDDGNQDLLIERFYSTNNHNAGLSLEANYGPIVIRDSIFYGNNTGINGFDNSGVLIENSMVFDNFSGQIRMGGSTTLTEEELLEFEEGWARHRQSRRHIPRDWTIRDSFVGSSLPGSPYMFSISVRGGELLDEEGQPRYRDFPDTFQSINTSFFHPHGPTYRGFPDLLGRGINFDEWQQVFTTEGMGNEFISAAAAEQFITTGLNLVGLPLTGFTGAIASAPVVEVTALERFAFEDGNVPARFRISRRDGDLSMPLQVIFQLLGDAQAGVDYHDPGDRIQIEPNQRYTDVVILPIADGVPGFAKSVRLMLEPDLDELYRLTGQRDAVLHIIDRDAISPSRIEVRQPAAGAQQLIEVALQNPEPQRVDMEAPFIDQRYSVVSSRSLDGPEHSWQPLSASDPTVAFTWVAFNRDGISNAINPGFAFPFFSNTFDRLFVHSNGFVTFEPLRFPTRPYSSPQQLPNAGDNTNPNTIAGFWSNFTLVGDSRVRTRAAADRFVVEYLEMNRFPAFGAAQRLSFQIVLFPNGQIDLVYEKNTYVTPSQSVGLQGPNQTDGMSFSFNDDKIVAPMTVRLMSANSWLQVESPLTEIGGSASGHFGLTVDGRGLLEGTYSTTLEISDTDGRLLYVLPVDLVVGDVLAESPQGSHGWQDLRFLGDAYTVHFPWVYTPSIGWLYVLDSSSTQFRFFLPGDGWYMSHHRLFPHVWHYGEEEWHFLDSDASSIR